MGGLFATGPFNAVDDVSFTLDDDRPEIFAIIGELGSGKTTLARMILNTILPTHGTIRFRGADFTPQASRRRQRGSTSCGRSSRSSRTRSRRSTR